MMREKNLNVKIRLHKKKLLIFAVLIFIIGNSLFNSSISKNISYEVRLFIERIIPYGTFDWLDWFLSRGLRKFAHFAEYFILGLLLTKLYFYKEKTLQRLLNTVFICFSVAFSDETIQLFSNRQSKISDVWLDLFGCAVGIVIYFAYKFFKKYKGEK